MRAWLSRLAALFRRRRLDDALDADVEAHLDLLAADYERRGYSPEDARLAARRAFGAVEPMKEIYRDRRGLQWIDAVGQDARYALRQLRREPSFALAAALTLGIAIGAVAAVFSVVNAVLLRPLPFAEAERLVTIHQTTPGLGRIPVSDQHFAAWRSLGSFENIALLWASDASVGGGGSPERIAVGRVSPSLFRTLGVQPRRGRLLRDDEDVPGRDRVAVISDELWRVRFGADAAIVGRTIELDGEPHDIVGVLPAGFRFMPVSRLYSIPFGGGRPQVWKPIALRESDLIRGFNFAAIGRLKSGVSMAQAQTEMDALQRTLPANDLGLPPPVGAVMTPLRDQVTSRSRTGLQLLLAAVAVVLAIACVNLANLLLARTSSRGREVAVRTAIGATRARVIRQFLTESVVLAALGGLVSLGVAAVAMRALVLIAPSGIPRLDEVAFDGPTVGFAALLSAAAGLVVGVVSSSRVARVRGPETLQGAHARDTGSRAARRVQSTLVVAEIALSAACLVTAGLLARSFLNLVTIDRGFTTANVLTADVALSGPQFAGPAGAPARVAAQRGVVDAVTAVPGVLTVGITTQQVLSGEGFNTRPLAEGSSVPPPRRPLTPLRGVTAGYFSAMGIRVVRGAVFADAEPRRVAVISSALADRLWPGQDPIGRRFRRGSDTSPLIEVVGVVEDVRAIRLEAAPTYGIYLPYAQFSLGQLSMAIKVAGDPAAFPSIVVAALRAVDPELAISAVRSMDEVLIDSVAEQQFLMGLVLLFAAAAIGLVGAGVYGVMAYAVGQRRAEIGVRLALGARPGLVQRGVMAAAGRLVLTGLAAGAVLVALGGKSLAPLLFGVNAYDAVTGLGACLLIGAIAALAAYVPARRASRVNPVLALKSQ